MLAIDQPACGQADSLGRPGDRIRCGFAFGTIVRNAQALTRMLAATST